MSPHTTTMHNYQYHQEGLLNMSSCKDVELCKPPSPREGISIQVTSTQLLQEPTNQEGFEAHTKHGKEQWLGMSLPS